MLEPGDIKFKTSRRFSQIFIGCFAGFIVFYRFAFF